MTPSDGERPTLFLLGTSHRVASGPVRERMHVDPDGVRALLARLVDDGAVEEAAALVTCGRFEVYGVSHDPGRVRVLLGRLAVHATGLGRGELLRHSYFHEGVLDVARHLFRVAAGLESAVQGEAQILGQVREMVQVAEQRALMGPLLHRLVETSVATGKRVRTETDIGRGTASLASASLKLVERRARGIDGRRAVVVGAGDTGALMARLLMKAGVASLAVVNRTPERAESLVRELGAGTAHRLDELPALLRDADVVVGAATAPTPLVDPAAVPTWSGEPTKPRFLVDLGHPRNLHPDLAGLPGVDLLDLEAVERRVASVRAGRAAQVPRAEAIVDEEVERFAAWVQSRAAVPVMRAVREQILAKARSEASRHARGLDDAQREMLHRFARSLARSLLHEPTVALREADPATEEGKHLLASAASLFGLPTDAPPAPGQAP